jgi:hypothetical protein
MAAAFFAIVPGFAEEMEIGIRELQMKGNIDDIALYTTMK